MKTNIMESKKETRTCIACREEFKKNQLIRIVRTPEGLYVVDKTGKMNGRGAYICKDKACLKKAIKSKRIQSNLEVEIPETIYLELEKELSLANEQ